MTNTFDAITSISIRTVGLCSLCGGKVEQRFPNSVCIRADAPATCEDCGATSETGLPVIAMTAKAEAHSEHQIECAKHLLLAYGWHYLPDRANFSEMMDKLWLRMVKQYPFGTAFAPDPTKEKTPDSEDV